MEKFEHGDDDEHSDEQRIGQRSGHALADGDAEFKGKDVKAWQMFSATVTADGKNASYTLNAEWEGFFTTEIGGNMAGLSG